MRDEHQPRILWIDAICINQEDLEERSEQVLRMEYIYEWAERVVVWLGNGKNGKTGGNNVAMTALEDLGRRVEVNWSTQTATWQKPITESSPWMDSVERINLEKHIPFNESTISALVILLSNDWFERLWVWQEIHLSYEAILVCGYDQIPWLHFRDALFCLSAQTKQGDLLYPLLRSLVQFCEPPKNLTTAGMLRRTRKLKCTDPRDKIYALQGILRRTFPKYHISRPDYRPGSEANIYKDFVINYITSSRRLEILKLCNFGKPPLNLPTWVPNLFVTENIDEYSLGPGYAAAGSRAEIFYNRSSTLVVKGVWCESTITSIQKAIPGERFEYWKVVSMIQQFWAVVSNRSPHDANLRMRLLCRTLMSGYFADTHDPPYRVRLSSAKCDILLLKILEDSADTSEDMLQFLGHLWEYIQGRIIFVTDDGHFGLGPDTTKPGDSVFVLMGSATPLILRPSLIKNGHQVIGPCYCSGLMDGEALLGPFHKHQRILRKFNPFVQRHSIVFLNTLSNQTELEDPRLGPLPQGWIKRRHKETERRGLLSYIDENTGKKCTQYTDPRLTSAALKARGVKIEDIVLI